MLCRWLPLFLVIASAPGCLRSDSDEPLADFNTVTLVPTSGVITLDGKPLAKAVVSFLPKRGPTAVGETDGNGHYALSYGREGAPVGEYTVAVSYLVSAEGEPQGLGPRSSLSAPPGMLSAKERLPRKYSDLGQSRLRAKVPPEGNTALDFDLEGPLLPGVDPVVSSGEHSSTRPKGAPEPSPTDPAEPPATDEPPSEKAPAQPKSTETPRSP